MQVDKTKPGKLNDAVAKVYDTTLTGWQGQRFYHPGADVTFRLETVTIAQVEKMIAADVAKKAEPEFVKKGTVAKK